MTNGPTTDVKSGRGFVNMFDQLTCFIRGRMFITQFLGFIPIRTSVVDEHELTGSDKQRPVKKQTDE